MGNEYTEIDDRLQKRTVSSRDGLPGPTFPERGAEDWIFNRLK